MSTCPHCGASHAASTKSCPRTHERMSSPGPCGTRIDRYEVQSLLGGGGMGAVYRARHARTHAAVALKLLKRQRGAESMIERFMQEARVAASVGSEHIVQVLDADVTRDGTAFIAMDLFEGSDLKRLAEAEGPLHPARVVSLLAQVLGGLSAAHAKGIVHRDMKPANVFVVRLDDGTEVAKVLDFGISRMHDADVRKMTRAGTLMGTPAYMAYEQVVDARDVDPRTDLYAVAVMLYELTSGKRPRPADSDEPLVPLRKAAPRLPVPLCAIVDKGLERKRERRWQSASQMSAALHQVMPLLGKPTVTRGGGKRAKDPEQELATRRPDDDTETA